MSFFKGYNPMYYFRRTLDKKEKMRAEELKVSCGLSNMCMNKGEYCSRCNSYIKCNK